MSDPRFYEGEVCAALPARYDRLKHKAYIYLTAGRDLLVFRQPDQPYVGLQIPGGTVDPGESHLGAALREFHEETGLAVSHALDTLTEQLVLFDNELGRDIHSRRLYHAAMPLDAPARQRERWEHFEMTPSAGGDPIRFELFWIDIDTAIDQGAGRFFTGFHAPLADLRARLEARR
ncbi:NUDIX hydrolase [Stappia sp.]|uniref:NUDIX hydrolase n=1 Tax=Stappia sp. TaxID=1870903 RepID=UPI003C7AA5C8